MSGGRTNKLIVVVGTKGVGKSDYLKNRILKQEKIFPKTLIVDTFDSDIWHNLETWNHPENVSRIIPVIPVEKLKYFKKGIARCYSNKMSDIMDVLATSARNTFLIFEDARKYFKHNLAASVVEFLLDSKQKNLDIIVVFHSLKQVPTDILDVADYLVLFKTNDAKVPEKFGWPEIETMLQEIKRRPGRFDNLTLELN